jgi:hypothetical protein
MKRRRPKRRRKDNGIAPGLIANPLKNPPKSMRLGGFFASLYQLQLNAQPFGMGNRKLNKTVLIRAMENE